MNSSAFSDDGKFSTRARVGFGASDLDDGVQEVPVTMLLDGMGLSTRVEISDRGSRRHAGPNE